MAGRPQGSRVTCKIKIGNVTFYSEVKLGTQKLLNLTKVSGELPRDKGKGKGFKGTQSYTLLLRSPHTIGGYSGCVSVDIPISPRCKLRQVYAWAYANSSLAGIITPDGIKYAWTQEAKRAKKNLLQKGLDAAGGVLHDIEDAASDVGDFIQGAENVAGTIGGYIQGVEGLAGDVITGAETLGGYLL